jgi:predicted DNA-binding mobile mystery protein A
MAKAIDKIRRRQLDRFFEKVHDILISPRPKMGWIREVRDALGMSASDLASRIGVIRQRVDRLERDEIHGKVTLESMKKAAHALDCEFVYFLVPRTSLEKTLNQQAIFAAKKIASEVEHTMKLEEQGTDIKSQKALLQDIANDMLLRNDRRIWKIK